MLTLIYFILILGVIIFVHEFGHFIFSKMFGVYVHEFSLGMGPKLLHYKRKNGETEYCLRLIPIGGFCSLAGEEIDDDDSIPKDRKMYSKPAWQRFLIMFFGAGNNFILALLLLFFSGLIWGSPSMNATITEVTAGYPAEQAGLKVGYTIEEINGHKVSSIDDVQLYLTLYGKKTVDFKAVDNTGILGRYQVTPKKEKINGEDTYKFGIVFESKTEKGFGKAIKYSFKKFGATMKQMAIVISSLFTGKLGLKNLSGPVGIYSTVGQTAKTGFSNIIQLIVLLSINVGFVNLIPFPAFDGGRILFVIIEKIKGSPISGKVENTIHTIGFILLLILMLYVTFNDILRLF